jgi:hypothetical protein
VNKKYFPWIALLAAALFLFWVKKNQRKTAVKKMMTFSPNVVAAKGTVQYMPPFINSILGMPAGSALIL